ncbi:ribosomal protein S21 [Chthonomonas calidirosea]|nr:30S ribosomal protein S21 [Chthonomonas calidirosea]CEK14721.1 ribosomal protein S21 [Chthonomonas calidirosea]
MKLFYPFSFVIRELEYGIIADTSSSRLANDAGRTRSIGGTNHLAQVKLNPGESLDVALKRFKKMIMESGILKEAREHEHYEKPSDRRRREEAARQRKLLRARRQAEAREGR